MTISLRGGGGTVDFETSPWAILEGSGLSARSPLARGRRAAADGETRTIQLRLLLAGGSADGIQAGIRNVERILEYADEQQRGRRGYPDSFTQELDCYLNYAPSSLTTGGQLKVVGGVLDLDDDWYSQQWWTQRTVKATLTLECRRDIYGAEVTGTKPATALTSQPFSIAATDTGGNTGIAPAPIRLGIHAASGADPINRVYGAIYPDLGTLIAPILNTGSVAADASLLNGDSNKGTITSTSYADCGTVSWTTDGKPKRYLVIIKRRADGTAPLNWRLTTGAGAVISDVWPDATPPANTWAALVAGQLVYPNLEMTGTTDGGGTPNTFNLTVRVAAARQSGSGSVVVDTDFLALVPMDTGAYFAIKDNSTVFGAGTYDWLHIYNDDGMLRANLADGPPGGTVTTISPTGVTPSGRPLPTLFTGNNKAVVVGILNSGSVLHTFNPDLQWTIRPRLRSM